MIFSLIQAIDFPSWIKPEIFKIPGTPLALTWYGLAYVVGIFMAYRWAVRSVRNKEIWRPNQMTRESELIPNQTKLEDFAFWCFLGIIVGGRVGYIILYDLQDTLLDPLSALKVWNGGMSFHGGFAGVCLAAWWINRRNPISLWRWADMAAIGAPLGLGAVRLANFINQELYGRETDVPWAFIFRSDPQLLARHPSQLYEAFLEGLMIFLILWYVSRKHKALTKPGVCAGLFFLLYGSFRTFVEFFREADASLFFAFIKDEGLRLMVDTTIEKDLEIIFGLTRGMAYSIPMIIIGLLILRWALKRPPVAPKFMPEPEKPQKAENAA